MGASDASFLPLPQSNGGCSPYAMCKSTGPGQRTCICDAAHTVGDGFTCRARVGLVMMPKLDPGPNHGYACPRPHPRDWLRPPDLIPIPALTLSVTPDCLGLTQL